MIRKGIIKINPYKFQPMIRYVDGKKYSWSNLIDNVLVADIHPKHHKFAYDNMNKEVEFTIDNKDFALIKFKSK
jgi:hypothetical protein